MAAGGRTPKQRRFDMAAALRNVSNTPRRRRGSCKCLFGMPDRDETRRLIAEQYNRDRKRFIRRFNFDIETECVLKTAKLDSPVKFCEEDKENSPSPVRSAAEALGCVSNTDLRVLGSPSRRSAGSNGSSPRTPRTPRTPRAARTPRTPRTPASRRQLQMTDYWTLRKHTESTSSDKEN
ncbi:cyclin-dependent kinase inhibitor domain-containing protein [Phthorimaea operculella]|nr:cyclin-dependent kinase inhibitor domain-containing protein [Phthorimaea operculella]